MKPIGHYDVLRRIAVGGLSEVYLARDTVSGDRVAIKRLLPHLVDDDEFVTMAEEAARLTMTFAPHPNVVRGLASGRVDGVPYLALELVHGANLRELIAAAEQRQEGPLPVPQVLRIVADVAAGLHHVHEAKQPDGTPLSVVHRCVSPTDILVGVDGVVRLGGFSVARAAMRSTRSGPGVLKGILRYMAPEVVGGRPVDRRADVFALGIVLHELLTGRPLFGRATDLETLNAVTAFEIPLPSLARTAASGGLDAIVLRALAREPEDRFPDAASFGQALEEALANTGSPFTRQDLARYMATRYPAEPEEQGKPLSEARWVGSSCAQCAAQVPPHHRFCLNCGHENGAPRWDDLDSNLVFGLIDAPKTDPVSYTVDSAPLELLPSKTLVADRYRVVRHLGKGGFAHVYLMEDTRDPLHTELVVKIPIAGPGPDGAAKQFRSRLKAWKVLSADDATSRHFVRLERIEEFEVSGQPAVGIFMEHMVGGNLLRWVKSRWRGHPRTRAELATLIRLFLQACEAVRALHRQGLLHRDIKPSNFLVDANATQCKLADFELLLLAGEKVDASRPEGTAAYMAAECFLGQYTIASEVFALGATLCHLLTGELPFEALDPAARQIPPLPAKNPLVGAELWEVVERCLNPIPSLRPQSADELLADLQRLGLGEDSADAAPLTLARLLREHLPAEDLAFLVRAREREGYRSTRSEPAHRLADVLEELCYTAPASDVLEHHCTTRQLATLGTALALPELDGLGRPELVAKILTAVGFRKGPEKPWGVWSALVAVEGRLDELNHATTADECLGIVHAGLLATERVVGLLARFYSRVLWGSGAATFLERFANGKPASRMTFAEKRDALQALVAAPPEAGLPLRVRQVFTWPILPAAPVAALLTLVKKRNLLVHAAEFAQLDGARRDGREQLSRAVEVLETFAGNPMVPRALQIVSRHEDVWGRHAWLGRDEKDRTERIFTPVPLTIGAAYLMLPLTEPVRVNPLIFPLD